MKNLISIVLLLGIFATMPFITGCLKKGEDDPFLSFKSRKSRVSGDWIIESYTEKTINKVDEAAERIINLNMSGGGISQTTQTNISDKDTTYTWNGTVKKATYSFDDNGQMSYEFEYILYRDSSGTDENTDVYTEVLETFSTVIRADGTWNFLDKIDDYKKKERIVLIFQNQTTTYETSRRVITQLDGATTSDKIWTTSYVNNVQWANGEEAEVWALRELRKNKIVMTSDINDLTISSSIINNAGVLITDGSRLSRVGDASKTLTLKE